MGYQVWVLDDTYNRVALLNSFIRLRYRLALNSLCGASIDLPANDNKIELCALGSRLQIIRDGVLVWGGMIEGESWSVAATAPAGDTYALDAIDYGAYLEWRTHIRPADDDYDRESGPADDVAKAYVRKHCGPSATTARRFTDVSVAANEGKCSNVTKLWVGGTLLEHLERLGAERAFWWRMVPTWGGCEFRTAYPLWGVDRTKGNGVSDELVFSLDRRNVSAMSYRRDLRDHRNYVYTGGAGEGRDQIMSERSDAGAIAAFRRRELWNPATQYVTVSGCDAEGDRALAEHAVSEEMAIVPAPGVVTPGNLGDQVTVFERRYGRAFEYTAIITAIDVTVEEDGVESIRPELIGV